MSIEEANKKNITVSFCCPAYYDELNIEKVVEKAHIVLSKMTVDFEIVVVDDGSPDNTGKVIDKLAKRYKEVKAIHHPRNLGYGEAIKTAIKNTSNFKYIVLTDGDNQYDAFDLEKFFPMLEKYEIVIGYRVKNGNGFVRRLISKVFNMTARVLFKMPFKDLSCAFKIINKEFLNSIVIEGSSPFVPAEIIIKLYKKGYSIGEIGIESYPRIHGRSSSMKIKNVIKSIYEMILFFWKIRFSK